MPYRDANSSHSDQRTADAEAVPMLCAVALRELTHLGGCRDVPDPAELCQRLHVQVLDVSDDVPADDGGHVLKVPSLVASRPQQRRHVAVAVTLAALNRVACVKRCDRVFEKSLDGVT